MPSRADTRGIHRGVYSRMLDGADFQALAPLTRHVLLTARLSLDCGPACLFLYSRERLAQQTGWAPRQVEGALVETETTGWTQREGALLWIVNGLRHDPSLRPSNPHHVIAVQRAIERLPRLALVGKFCRYYPEWVPPDMASQWPSGDTRTTEYRVPSTEDRRLTPPSAPPRGAASSQRQDAIEILEHLNRLTGRRFKPEPGSLGPILARLREGATVRECKGVISQRCQKWRGDEKMAEFLRPATLFAPTKFAAYRADLPAEEPDEVAP